MIDLLQKKKKRRYMKDSWDKVTMADGVNVMSYYDKRY